MRSSLLVKLLGFSALLIHGDPLVLDRWLWLKKRLPRTRNDESLLDCGCGSGAFSIGAARRGYVTTGISNQGPTLQTAEQRAGQLAPGRARFEAVDVRRLAERNDFAGSFDFAVCLEVIEHIADDRKLMVDLANCIKPGGRLLLTTPNYHYVAITADEEGPRSSDEHVTCGWHVRRGYTAAMLSELCDEAGLVVEDISYCSGFLSQKLTMVLRRLARLHYLLGWMVVLPLRPLPPLLDGLLTRLLGWRYYSIGLEAYKPRFGSSAAP